MNFSKNKKSGFVLMIDAEGEFGRIPFNLRNNYKHKIKKTLT